MTEKPENKSIVTRKVTFLALGILILGTIALLGFAAATPGDTPVVLIGGSVTFKAGARYSALTWQQVGNTAEYFVSPNYEVSAIALKNYSDDDGSDNPTPRDANPAKDKIHVDISNVNTWEMDVYARNNASGTEAQVASLTPVQNSSNTEIHLKLVGTGYLCPNGTNIRIKYSQTSPTCSDPPTAYTLTRIDLLIDNGSGVTTPSGTLRCVDDSATPTVGHCRIVFRGPSS